MKRICVPLADGFEEIEAVTMMDVFRRAGFSVMSCGVSGTKIRGSHDITVDADITLDAALEKAWDLVVLPGGMPGATNLRDDARIGQLLEKVSASGGYVGAICAAPIALAHFGFLAGKKATSYPSFAGQMPGAEYREERVVFDGTILTSRGPGTAMEFALAITELLAGRARADELRKQMLID
jgi:4-methyl-5(b-hydroxyethyl)-thiazole monophosphate biosynthesis